MPRSKRHVCSTAPVRRALQHSYIAQRRIERAKEGVSRVHADSLRGALDTYQGRDLTNPRFASEIALQLLRSGRAEEALSYLDRARPSVENRYFGQTEWTDARIAALDALQRPDEAQALRLAIFQSQLSPSHLRAFLDRLPDFDDFEAEERALNVVAEHPNVHAALAFLVESAGT